MIEHQFETKEIEEGYRIGRELGASHMVIKTNDVGVDDELLFIYPDEDIYKRLNEIKDPNKPKIRASIDAVYSLDMPLELQRKNRWNINPSVEERIPYYNALQFATEKHKGKYRKGSKNKEYITHPIEVSKLVKKYMENDEELETYMIAALLHDTLEDTETTYEELKENFGDKVADIVKAVTSDKEEKNKQGKDLYLANKMLKMEDKILILKLCDRLHNIDESRYANEEFIKKYVRETNFIINYLLLNRELNSTELKIVNKIMNTVKEVSVEDPMPIKPKKMLLENPTC